MDLVGEPAAAADTLMERLTAIEEIVGTILQRDPDFAVRIMEASNVQLNHPLDDGESAAEIAFRERVELAKQELLYDVLQSTNPSP